MSRCCRPLILLCALMVGCPRTPPPNPEVVVAPPKNVEPEVPRQGLTKADRDEFHHLSMGSELIPLAWAQALECATTDKPFLDNVERFGLILDPDNADGLPIGLSAAPSKDARFVGKMIGLNCAACHTGELTYKGKSIRLEGASSLFDAEAFTKDLLTSLAVTVKSPAKLLAFVKRQIEHKDYAKSHDAKERPHTQRLLGKLPGLDLLRKAGDMEKALIERLQAFHKAELARPATDIELGMILREGVAFDKEKLRDFIGNIEHGDLTELLKKEAGPDSPLAKLEERESAIRDLLEQLAVTMRLMKARLHFATKAIAEGRLKLANTHGGPGRVDDFGAARNLLFDVKDARGMDAPCSIPHLWGTHSMRWTNWDGSTQSSLERSMATALAGGAVFDPKTYKSTVPVRNLGRLEELASKILAPVWPEDVFGAIDKGKAERGAKLFKEHCAKCHVDAKRPADVDAGKDWPPDLLVDLKEIGTDPNRVTNYSLPLGDRSFGQAVQEETGKYLDQACKDDKISADDLKKYRDGHANVWRTTSNYAARPLSAVWATPPYLHNGSVPTLYDLLLPADQRPESFAMGHRDFDPVNVGFTRDGKGSFRFDTKLPGNRNTGHEYGTKLTDVERYEVIEYLKMNY